MNQLTISNLHVSVNQKPIIKGLNVTISAGNTHALMGPNGSGKSSLAYTLLGHPNYTITQGTITFNGTDITHMPPDERARLGMFLAVQHPQEIPGVTLFELLKHAYALTTDKQVSVESFKRILYTAMDQLELDYSFAHRPLNQGCSGGEKKRLELAQLMVLQPKIAVLDEIDSGLDVDALKVVARCINHLQEDNPAMSVVLITHYQRILQYIKPDVVHIMHGGVILNSGDHTLAQQIERHGYGTAHG